MRYLLEEQSKLEGYHGDVMNPLLNPSRHVLQHQGEGDTAPKVSDLERVRSSVVQEVSSITRNSMRQFGQEIDQLRTSVRTSGLMSSEDDEQRRVSV